LITTITDAEGKTTEVAVCSHERCRMYVEAARHKANEARLDKQREANKRINSWM
jgi:hypothetical protein